MAAAAALLTGGASAGRVHQRHAHDLFKAEKRGNDTGVCVPGCSTVYSTITGPAGRTLDPQAPRRRGFVHRGSLTLCPC